MTHLLLHGSKLHESENASTPASATAAPQPAYLRFSDEIARGSILTQSWPALRDSPYRPPGRQEGPEKIVRAMNYAFRMFGHGRALEVYLIGVKLWYGCQLMIPGVEIKVVALNDLWWFIPDYFIGAIFLLMGSIQLVGLILNLKGYESSWIWRTVGASTALWAWSYLIIKSIFIGAIATGAFPFWVMSFLASTFLLFKGVNRLPIPGAPGAL